jgi:photosystem II stability/assembly factor-like uncharacterized protein
MYVGTESGLIVLAELDGGWRPERTTLDGKPIGPLVASRETGTLFASVPRDGIYASSDGGRTWDRSFAGDVRSLATDPAHRTIYAGTEPIHLFRSVDDGDHWVELDGLQRMPEEIKEQWWFPVYPHEPHVLSIHVDETDPRMLYLGLEHGGIVRSDDGGERWVDISEGIEYLDIHMVASDLRRQNLVYAATARAFYRSEDYGRDWVLSEDGLTRDYMHDFLVRPGPQTSLFMTTGNGTPPAWLRESGAESAIYRSEDGGQNWRQLGGGLPASAARMVWALVGDPADQQRLYAGMGDYTPVLVDKEAGGGDVWTSSDLGATWTKVYDAPAPVRTLCVTTS